MVDPNVKEAERLLQGALGVRVTINDRKGKGKILIEYASLEDFDRILEVLGEEVGRQPYYVRDNGGIELRYALLRFS